VFGLGGLGNGGGGGVGVGVGGPPQTVNGLATLTSIPDASRCPPTASLADLEMSPTKSIEAWRSTSTGNSSSPDPSLPLSPLTALSSTTLPSTATFATPGRPAGTTAGAAAPPPGVVDAGEEYAGYGGHHYGPYPDVIAHPTAPTTSGSYYPTGGSSSGGPPPDMKGWDSTHPIHSASSDEQGGHANGEASGRGGSGSVLLGGANAKVPEDKQRQRVVQACEKCRERKAAVSFLVRGNPTYPRGPPGLASLTLRCSTPLPRPPSATATSRANAAPTKN
jgi:hypothetical protein